MIEMTVRTDVILQSGDNDFFLTHVWADDNEDFTERLDLAINLIIDSTDHMVKQVCFPADCDKWVYLYYVDHGQFPARVMKEG